MRKRLKMPSRQIKRLVQAGYTNLAVVVPQHWAKYWELEKGNEIEVVCSGNTMTVVPVKTMKTKKKKGEKDVK